MLAERVEEMRKGQAERLMAMLEELLGEAGIGWHDLSALGVGTGPGNFTGTRIAVAAARGLALGLGVPAEGVTLPEAYASGRDVVVCLDAPRGRVHVARGGEIVTVAEDALPKGWDVPLTGPAAARVAEATARATLPSLPLAPAIARIAAGRASAGRPRPAPFYLRPADAAPPADPPPVLLP